MSHGDSCCTLYKSFNFEFKVFSPEGLPEGAREELEKPDIKLLADTLFQVNALFYIYLVSKLRSYKIHNFG